MNNIRWQIVIFVILGFLAGISGGLVVFNTVLPDLTASSEQNLLRNNAPDIAGGLLIDTERMGREMNQVVVEFYRPKQTGSSVVSNILLGNDLLGRGSVITSDGWVLTSQSAFGGSDPLFVTGIHNGLPIKISTVVRDRATGLVLLKTSIKNVPSIKLGTLANVRDGEAVAIGGTRLGWRSIFIVDKHHEFATVAKEIIHTSEDLSYVGTFFGQVDKTMLGAPVVSRRNELVGVIAQNKFGHIIVPAEYIASVKEQVFAAQKIERPYLGVTYINLPKNSLDAAQNLNRNGALIAADFGLGAAGIVVNSPAKLGGLKVGDIVKSVNDEEINQSISLSELLLAYKKGDTIELKILRGSEELTIKITLGGLLTSTTSVVKVGG